MSKKKRYRITSSKRGTGILQSGDRIHGRSTPQYVSILGPISCGGEMALAKGVHLPFGDRIELPEYPDRA